MVKAWETWTPGDSTEQSRRPTFHGDVLDGEAKDDGPDHAQGHLQVPVDNLCRVGGGGNMFHLTTRPQPPSPLPCPLAPCLHSKAGTG